MKRRDFLVLTLASCVLVQSRIALAEEPNEEMQKKIATYAEQCFNLEPDKIAQFDVMENLPAAMQADKIIDAKQGIVMPAWIDSHTHLVHAATREEEFAMRIAGISYEQIAANGGGILNSAAKLQTMAENESNERLQTVMK